MIWLVTITICLLITKVVLATIVPCARRAAAQRPVPTASDVAAADREWPPLTELNGYRAAPVTVRSDDRMGR